PPPPPITIPKPLMIFFVIVAGAILVGSLYAIIDSARSKLPPSARADNSKPQVPPPPHPIPSADATRPEADVNGEPWTFDPHPRIRTAFPLTAHYLQKLPTDGFSVTPEHVNGTIYFGAPYGTIF